MFLCADNNSLSSAPSANRHVKHEQGIGLHPDAEPQRYASFSSPGLLQSPQTQPTDPLVNMGPRYTPPRSLETRQICKLMWYFLWPPPVDTDFHQTWPGAGWTNHKRSCIMGRVRYDDRGAPHLLAAADVSDAVIGSRFITLRPEASWSAPVDKARMNIQNEQRFQTKKHLGVGLAQYGAAHCSDILPSSMRGV